MPSLLYCDVETCGLHSMPVLIQYAYDDGKIVLYEIWKEPVHKTLALLEEFTKHSICGFNLVFDAFHLCKLYTIWRLLPSDWIPEEHIEEIALKEPEGRDGPCLKFHSACDLLLHARKGEFQCLMQREDIRIRRVPTALAYALAQELEKRIELDGIFFARFRDKDSPKWKVYDIFKEGELVADFKDVVLKFAPASGLKFLAEYACGLTPASHFEDVELDRSHRPFEYGYAPFALAVSDPEKNWEVQKFEDGKMRSKGHAWPAKIKAHIEHWSTNEAAREYALNDIVYTRALYERFGRPEPGDDDSVLACMVAAVRWHGFKVDIEGIKVLLENAKQVVAKAPININKPSEVRHYLSEVMDEVEAILIAETTEKSKLVEISQWTLDRKPHPAAERAKEILTIKHAVKEIELYDKLLIAGRFHASFNVIGTLSSRMSGGDGLNAQAIKKTKEVRSRFPLAWEGMELSIGDFSSFEVVLADAVYGDEKLHDLLVSGRSPHAVFGTLIFPGKTYDDIIASKGTKEDMYTVAKSSVFALLYAGNAFTLHENNGTPLDVAERACEQWEEMFPGIRRARLKIENQFHALGQPGGPGTAVLYNEPADYCETFLGFRRYFTLENKIIKELFSLAHNTPTEWKKCPVKVVRRDRVQTAGGAVSSALYGAAFAVQGANTRAAANHLIQSVGALITKRVQRNLWDLQPEGVNDWRVCLMQVHDEVISVTHPDCVDAVAEVVQETVESYRDKVPLIAMDWVKHGTSWADK